MMKQKIALFIISLTFILKTGEAQEKFKPEWESLKKHKVAPEWFADAKLGVYFHWGIYSVPATGDEWYGRYMYIPGTSGYEYHKKNYGIDKQYHDFIQEWKGNKFSAKEWVDMFQNMGAKFIGTMAEHHDGFSLWESKVNQWNSKAMGPHVDVVKSIAQEVKKRDLKFMTPFHHGFHMNFYPKQEHADILRPVSHLQRTYKKTEVPQDVKYRILYGNTSYKEECDIWLGKLNEVIDTYCPDYIWMDFAQFFVQEDYRLQFLANYFNKAEDMNKEVVVNTKGSYFPIDLAVVNLERLTMPDITPFVWVSDFWLGSTWGYNKNDRTALSPNKAIRTLADVVSKNGVMILGAAPMADGTIPEEQVASMKSIGEWLALYGEAIYNTRPFVEFGQGPTTMKADEGFWNTYKAYKLLEYDLCSEDFRYTRNGNNVYAIQLGWPGAKKETILKSFAGKAKDLKIKSVSVLGSIEKTDWKKTKDGLKVVSPSQKPAEGDAAIVYKITLE